MLRIDRSHTDLPDVESYRDQFRSHQVVEFREAFAPGFLDMLDTLADGSTFVQEEVKGLGYRAIEQPPISGGLIMLALARPEFLSWIKEVTGVDGVNDVVGKVVESGREPGEKLDWHDDLSQPHRRLGVTINLSQAPYEGGMFELRRKGETDLLFRYKHDCKGAMLVFKVNDALEPQVTPVTDGLRRVFAGWFVHRDPEAAKT